MDGLHSRSEYVLLTPWSRDLLEKPTGSQLVQKFPAFYGTRLFITAFTRARLFPFLRSYQRINPGPRSLWMVRNMIHLYGEAVLASRPTPKVEDHPLSAVRSCLFNTFAATLHIGGRSSIRNLRTRHAVVTGTRLSWLDVLGDEKTPSRRNLCSVPSSPYPSPYTDYAPRPFVPRS